MMNAARPLVLFLISVVFLLSCALKAHEGCQVPPAFTTPPGSNIFTEQQEIDLGEILAERLPRYVRVTGDAAVTAYFARIGERLAKHLPATQLRFRYFLVDLPVPDAFSTAGDRIYVSRRMVSFVRNEDEMASIIGHEMGHIVTHLSAIDITDLLREVLGVTAVSDRQDILKKYDALEENWRRNPGAFRQAAKRRVENELTADQMGLYAVAAAGYSPQSFVDIFDRTAGTSGKTGNWLSDFFRTTKPDQLRLREMLKSVENMPNACVDQQPLPLNEDFEKWRAAVHAFSGWNRRAENLHGVLAKVTLDPFVRRSIGNLKFSPDGKYILAQQADTIYVLTREPFAYLFQIQAPDAWQPQFTPDSKSIAFTDGDVRVEVWDIATQGRARVDQPWIEKGCFKTLLSPDANTLACLRHDEALSLIDLPSGTEIFEKKSFARNIPGPPSEFSALAGPKLGFSPDGHYFLAGGQYDTLGVDVRSRLKIPLPSAVRERLADGFVFLGSDRLLVSPGPSSVVPVIPQPPPSPGLATRLDTYPPESRPATLFAFPSGKVMDHPPVGQLNLLAPAHGDYVVLRPIKNYAVGVMDLKTKRIFLAAKQQAFDIYDDVFVHQLADGDLGLYVAKSRRLQARARLPLPSDSSGFLRAFASPDLKWLAASEGPIWDLTTGKKLYYLRNFLSGWFDGDRAFCADFPKHEDTPRTLAHVDLNRQNITPLRKIDDRYAFQNGPFFVARRPLQKNGLFNPCNWKFPDYDPMDCNVVVEVSDMQTGKVLWYRRFSKDNPRFLLDPEQGRALITWPSSAEAARDEIKTYPRLAEQLAALKGTKGVYFIEVLDAPTGKVLAANLVDAGGQALISTMGDRIIVSHQDYMEIYSLATGLKQGEILGWPRAYCKTTDQISVQSGNSNKLAVYDLNSLEKLDEFTFSSDVGFDQFSRDGKRLFVLTADQTAYFLDVSNPHRPTHDRP